MFGFEFFVMLLGKLRFLLAVCLCCLPCMMWAETGEGTYRFLNFPYSAKTAGIGGENISVFTDNPSQLINNPALFRGAMRNALSLTYVNYLADANGGVASYAFTPDSLNYFGFNFMFMGYGDLEGYDKYGTPMGDFSAGDFAWNLVYGRYLGGGVSLGVSMKPVYSHIDTYSSFGLAFDVGAAFLREDWGFSAGFAVRNFGLRFTDYYDDQPSERLPWNMQIGVSKKLAHAPFRFSISYDHLNDWNLKYTKAASLSGEAEDVLFADMLFRHFVFGVEILFSKYFHIDVGYNHRRNREYALANARAINGFSFGAGFAVYKFNLDAAYAQYAPSGGTFTLTLSSNIDSFKK